MQLNKFTQLAEKNLNCQLLCFTSEIFNCLKNIINYFKIIILTMLITMLMYYVNYYVTMLLNNFKLYKCNKRNSVMFYSYNF